MHTWDVHTLVLSTKQKPDNHIVTNANMIISVSVLVFHESTQPENQGGKYLPGFAPIRWKIQVYSHYLIS